MSGYVLARSSVNIISQYWMPDVCEMNSELMSASGFGNRLDYAYFVTREQQSPMSYGRICAFLVGFTHTTKNNAVFLALHICADRVKAIVAFYFAA